MKAGHRLLLSFALAATLWAVISWPLPRHLFRGIPSSAHNTEQPAARRMIAGDHLQLLYHFQLLPEALSGRIPWFRNPYEFNRGNDDPRIHRGFYYLPFSAVYTIGYVAGGQAFGWNLAGFTAVWLGLLGMLALSRRYGGQDMPAVVAAGVGFMIPYGWSAQMGGSPTGFGMALVPWFLLGIDRVVRDPDWRGGVLAGGALLAACWSDTHTFFFIVLAAPAWAIVALTQRPDAAVCWRQPRTYTRWLKAGLPLAGFAILTLLATLFMKSGLGESQMAGGRSPHEAMIFSPIRRGFFHDDAGGMSFPVFIGYGLPVFLGLAWVAAGAALVLAIRRRQPLRPPLTRWIAASLILIGIVAVMVLALGPRGPQGGWLFYLVRRWIPPYRMIRQPSKIMLLLPSLAAVGLVLGAAAADRLLETVRHRRRWLNLLLILAAAGMAFQMIPHTRPTLCLLRADQAAYAAVADHAAQRGHTPHAVILPLWPGDSHYGSVYEHYVARYAIRMLNGYSPVVSRDYFDQVFLRYQSLNQGAIDDGQLDGLRAMGIGYVLLHEDLFPEKVSPFPVVQTLKALLDHPRLLFLAQDERVWSFVILADGEPPPLDSDPPATPADWTWFFPARHWEIEQAAGPDIGARVADPDTSGGAYTAIDGAAPAFALRPTGIPPTPGLRLLTRLRGSGYLTVSLTDRETDDRLHTQPLAVDTADWQWAATEFELDRFRIVTPEYEVTGGRIDLDSVLLMAGEWRMPEAGESISLPAPLFFRAGYIDAAANTVVFSAADDPRGVIFYGPHLPLTAGAYTVTVDFDASVSGIVGAFHLRSGSFISETVELRAGTPGILETVIPASLPVRLQIDFHRTGDLTVRRIIFEHMPQ